MGAYFSTRAEKTLSLFSEPRGRESVAKETLRAGKLFAKDLAASFDGKEREAAARTLTSAIIAAYWERTQEQAQHPFPLLKPFVAQDLMQLPDTSKALASVMGEAASRLDPLAAAYLISVTYTAMLPDSVRSTLGAYYTPPPLAERLVSMATRAGVNWDSCRILDPACGGGAFLSAVATPILEKLLSKDPEERLLAIESRVRGFEVDPFSAWLSQVFLESTVMPLCQGTNRRLSVVVQVRDSLKAVEPKDKEEFFDLVIGNPPYGRVTLPKAQRERFRRSLYGHANLYGLFTDLAVRFARYGGIVAYVTPTSFLAGEYFKSLRGLLIKTARPVNIDFVSARKGIFDDALQETMLATYRKAALYLNPPSVHFLHPTEDDGLTVDPGGYFDLPEGGGPWLVPRSQTQAKMIVRLQNMPHRLADYGYKVSTGPLVWNRHKAQLTARRSDRAFPLIWAESVTADGRFQFRAEKRNHLPYFKTRPQDDWLITRKPCVLLQRTTAKEQTSRLIAAELPARFLEENGAVVIENHLNLIRPTNGSPAVSATVLAKLLNNPIVDRAFRCISGSVAVSAYELENLPLPDPERLTQILGRRKSSDAIGQACEILYGPAGDL